MTHALERTSPFGQPFVGTCIKCGQTDLKSGDALLECPADDLVSNEAALLTLLEEPATQPEPAAPQPGDCARCEGYGYVATGRFDMEGFPVETACPVCNAPEPAAQEDRT